MLFVRKRNKPTLRSPPVPSGADGRCSLALRGTEEDFCCSYWGCNEAQSPREKHHPKQRTIATAGDGSCIPQFGFMKGENDWQK